MQTRYIIPLLLLLCVALTPSCNKEETLSVDDEIFGLGGDTEEQSPTDIWLNENFVQKYNIKVKYKWSTYEVAGSAQLVPIFRSLVQPMMNMLRQVWFDPYEITAGEAFVKQLTPKNVVLVGSLEYNKDGTAKLGQAEGANKITLFDCNAFAPDNEIWLRRLLATIEHEFGHILCQTRAYDKSFKTIGAGTYNATGWYNISDVAALLDGFLSSYSMSGVDEDFVEVLSLIMVYGPEWLDVRYQLLDMFINAPAQENETPEQTKQRLAQSARASKGLDRLNAKIQAVDEYMLNTWGIHFLDAAGGEKGLVSEVQIAIDKVLKSNAGVSYTTPENGK